MKKAVILAGGLGTRLRPLTNIVPKPLLPIGESTVLEIQITSLRDHGFDEVFVATNYMADFLERFVGNGERYGIKVTISRESERLGTCGPLSLLRDRLAEPFLMMNGDILTSLDFEAFGHFVERVPADLTVATKELQVPFRFGRVEGDGDFLLAVEEKPNFHQEIVAGIYGFKPGALELVPDGRYFGMDDLIKAMLGSQRRVGRYVLKDYWIDIGELSDYELAKETHQIEASRRRS